MRKKKRKKIKLNRNGKILVGVIAAIAILLIVCSIFGFMNRPVSHDDKNIPVIIEDGDTYSSLASFLKEQNFIRSTLGYKLYIKLNAPKKSLKAGRHYLRRNMSIKQILNVLQESPASENTVMITFKEGINIRGIANLIEEKTVNRADDFYYKLSDQTYLNELIQRYWFLSDEIKNPNIYYSLEGYLYPNTYEFDRGASVGDIIEKMLNEMEHQLEPYKNTFTKSKYTIHQILTVASLSELEAVSKEDRERVSRVFYNRLDNKMALGSDVTTYYAAKVDMGDRDLYQSELDDVNSYNTRSSSLAGKLPVGPICSASIDAIATAINPAWHDYLYFVADKNRKVYFTKSSSEHDAIIQKLRAEDLWYTYD